MGTDREWKSSGALGLLEEIAGGPLTFGNFLESIRKGMEMSPAEFAAKLEISKSHLCDVERGRKVVSAERAARWAELLGYSSRQFVELALQAELERAGLSYRVRLTAA